jgi:hypothetical protein
MKANELADKLDMVRIGLTLEAATMLRQQDKEIEDLKKIVEGTIGQAFYEDDYHKAKAEIESLKQHWSDPQTDLIVLLREEVTLMQKYLQEQNLREHFVAWRDKK